MLSTTPESVPSVADVSQTSSSDSKLSVARQLFKTPPSTSSLWNEIAGVYLSPSMDSFEGSEPVSMIFGSEANTITSLDLAVDIPTLLDKQDQQPSIWEALREQNRSDSKVTRSFSRSMIPNDSPKPPKRAKLASAPRQRMANDFSMFDNSNATFWPPRSSGNSKPAALDDSILQQDGFGAPVDFPSQSATAWKPKAESLERECIALKEIIRVDNFNILNLKKALETFDRACTQKTIEVELLMEELRASKQKIASLEERDVKKGETISNLKNEIDRLSKLCVGDTGRVASHKADSAAELRFENELFASQIIESEEELSQIRVMLEKKQSHNDELKGQLEELESRLCIMSIELRAVPHSVEPLSAKALSRSIQKDLEDEVESLSVKLDLMEGERKALEVRCEEELSRKDQEIEEIKAMVKRARENQSQHARENLARKQHETEMITHVSTMDQEIECLQQTLLEKEAEIVRLKNRSLEQKRPRHQGPSGLCGFSQCLFS